MTGLLQSYDRGTEILAVGDEKVIQQPNKQGHMLSIDDDIV